MSRLVFALLASAALAAKGACAQTCAGDAVRWPELSRPAASTGEGGGDAAVVAAVEDYSFLPPVRGALVNALAWHDYLVKTRGVPADRVVSLQGGEVTGQALREAAAKAASLAGSEGTLWFVFIGHGAPDAASQEGLLVGFDAPRSAAGVKARSLREKELLFALSQSRARAIVAVLDACFAGRDSGGREIVKGLQPLPRVQTRVAVDKRFAVLTAARTDQYAEPLPGASRPALSYLALGALRGWADAGGDRKVTAAKLHAYAAATLAAAVCDREQTPTLAGDGAAPLGRSAGEKGPQAAAKARPTAAAGRTGPKTSPERARDDAWQRLRLFLARPELDDEERKESAGAFLRSYGKTHQENPCLEDLVAALPGPLVIRLEREGLVRDPAVADMAPIPAGRSAMGSPRGVGETAEQPRHDVILEAFYIDRHEVTASQYRGFAEALGRPARAQPGWSGDDHPAVNVDWSDADEYCRWAGKRLPTEAEWERAARGGAGTRFSFGDDDSGLDEHAWHAGNAGKAAHPVGRKAPNQYGVFDMAGNAAEWTADWYDASYYENSPERGPQGPSSGEQRALRGGSWAQAANLARPAARGMADPADRGDQRGFRCAASRGRARKR
ncbi:MAG: SUMF1/EgtB/PvdO family nonheme iron enzyme [Elusimicrobia bacterium]|nr:SUMF1/EgtB/PvdO family nonheme iron enzyme [Elusimicrobiota bacterium]